MEKVFVEGSLLKRALKAIEYLGKNPFPPGHVIKDIKDVREDLEEQIILWENTSGSHGGHTWEEERK